MSNEIDALGYTALMKAYGAYPEVWIKGTDGKITNGSVVPEMKKGLDGPGQTLYLDHILDIDRINGIEWVPVPEDGRHTGADEKWYEMYKNFVLKYKAYSRLPK